MASDLIGSFILAIVQGITEWLPISSSGHLALTEKLLGFEGGLLLQVALHFGTLMAVFVYFGKDITDILQDFLEGKWKSKNGKLALFLIVATIPAGILGLIVKDYFDLYFLTLPVLAFGFAITGVFLFIASFYQIKKDNELSYWKAFFIGLAQMVAIVPGISRAGSTLSMGLLLGLKEKEAMRFSFLMAVPVILGANILVIGEQQLPSSFIWATLLCFIIALGVLHLVYRYILVNKRNLRWFALYCLLLALALGTWLIFLAIQ